MKKIFLLTLIFGLYTHTNAEQYQRHKYTCPESQGECSEGERAVVKLVNDTYWEMLSERIKENKHYKCHRYWVYSQGECKYTVGAKEDIPTHNLNLCLREFVQVFIVNI